jgi:hypothetical protein
VLGNTINRAFKRDPIVSISDYIPIQAVWGLKSTAWFNMVNKVMSQHIAVRSTTGMQA